jgi:hypothetical protein
MKAIACLLSLLIVSALAAQSIPLTSFSDLTVGGSFNVKLIPSDKDYAVIVSTSGDEKDISIDQKNETVSINWRKSRSRSMTRTAEISLYYTQIAAITTSGGAMVQSQEAIETAALSINCSSGGSANLVLDTKQTTVQVSSGASSRLRGHTDTLKSEASSGASVNATRLEAKKVYASSSSGASIKVTATESFEGQASSGSSIMYGGSPEQVNYDRQSRGGGSIKPM